MDAIELSSGAFWASSRPVVFGPPRLAGEVRRLEEALTRLPAAQGGVVFASSGSSGPPKWVLLSKRALQASARMVNAHLGVGPADAWLLALPPWHVGGFGVAARVHEAGARLVTLEGDWNPRRFCETMDASKASHTALVPTQVHDLVTAGRSAPACLRAVVVGGGALTADTWRRARELGWPVLPSYGMTETASQVATAALQSLDGPDFPEELPVLPGWEAAIGGDGSLRLRGEALCDGYLDCGSGTPRLRDPRVDGWFVTSDRVRLGPRGLTFLRRADRTVKILGELVDVAALEAALRACAPAGADVVLVAVDDPRAGARIVPVAVEGWADWETLVADFNRGQPGFARLAAPLMVDSLPRTALGKPDLQALRQLVVEMSP